MKASVFTLKITTAELEVLCIYAATIFDNEVQAFTYYPCQLRTGMLGTCEMSASRIEGFPLGWDRQERSLATPLVWLHPMELSWHIKSLAYRRSYDNNWKLKKTFQALRRELISSTLAILYLFFELCNKILRLCKQNETWSDQIRQEEPDFFFHFCFKKSEWKTLILL